MTNKSERIVNIVGKSPLNPDWSNTYWVLLLIVSISIKSILILQDIGDNFYAVDIVFVAIIYSIIILLGMIWIVYYKFVLYLINKLSKGRVKAFIYRNGYKIRSQFLYEEKPNIVFSMGIIPVYIILSPFLILLTSIHNAEIYLENIFETKELTDLLFTKMIIDQIIFLIAYAMLLLWNLVNPKYLPIYYINQALKEINEEIESNYTKYSKLSNLVHDCFAMFDKILHYHIGSKINKIGISQIVLISLLEEKDKERRTTTKKAFRELCNLTAPMNFEFHKFFKELNRFIKGMPNDDNYYETSYDEFIDIRLTIKKFLGDNTVNRVLASILVVIILEKLY